METTKTIDSKIIDFLSKESYGASCVEISKKISVSRPTVLKYLEVMKAQGIVNYEQVGIAKLWHLDKSHLLDILEKEREEASYRLKAILNVIGEPISIIDKDMKIIWVNKIYEELIGKLSEIKGNYCYKVIRNRDEICSDCIAIETFKTGKVHRTEKEYRDKDGKKHYFEVVTSPVKDKDGNIIGVLDLRRDITERKRLEKRLKESEKKYGSIFENVNVGIYRTTPGKKGNFIDVNPTFLKMFGYRNKEELLKINVSEIYQNPSDRKKFSDKLLKQGHVKNEILTLKKKDGTLIWVKDTAIAIYDDKNNVKYFDGITEDITEIKKLEEALKESEKRYREILEGVNVGIYRTTPGEKGRVIEANSYLLKLFGFKDKDDILKINVADYYKNPRDRELFEKKMREQGYIKNEKFEYRRKDGTPFWVMETAVAVYDENGNIKYYDGMFDDITEIKKLEEALKESEGRYRSLFENVNAGINRVTPGEKGKFIDVNSAFLKMLGYESKEELLKMNVCDTYQNPEERKRFSDKMLKQGYVKDEILMVKKKDGTPIIVRENAVVVKDENGKVKYFDCITEDITEKIELENALKESEERYRTMIENIPVGVYRTIPGKKGAWIEADPTIIKMFGYDSKEELFRINVCDLYKNPKDREKLNEKVDKYGFVKGEEFEYKRKDGSTFFGRIGERATYDEKGNVKYYDGVIEDVTEKKKLEDALKESEGRYREIFGNIDIGVYRTTPGRKAKLIDANPTFIKIFGYDSKEELRKVNICDLYQNPKDREEFDKKMLKQGYVKNELLEMKKKDGTPFWIQETSVAVYDENGKIKYYDGLIEDITKKSDVFENADDAIYMSTRKGKLLYINQTGVKLFGYKNKDELLAIDSVEKLYVNPKDREKFYKEIKKSDFIRNFKVELRRKDGSKFLASITSNARRDEKGEIIGYEGIIKEI